ALAPARDRMISEMRESGVEASIGTHHIPLLRFYRESFGYRTGDFPVSESVSGRAIALPLHTRLSSDEQAQVISVLCRVVS
ncbi:MAG TPA: DegT/DnrJ/EryC1/StrS family aminotransferase, partial [Gemmatimonadaceae bacterium]